MAGKDVYIPCRTNNIPGALDSHRVFSGQLPATNLSFRQLSANNFSFPELSATNFSANNLSVHFPESATSFSANNLSFPELSATNQYVPDYSANNLGDVWDLGINELGFNLAPDVWDLGINELGSNLAPNSDNTLEALTHISQSLPISPKEAIGVQNENNRSESAQILQIGEVMPVDSSAQKPIGENKGKRTGRTKIDIPLEDMLQYDTVKEAAFYLGVSESTVDRLIKKHTKKTWSEAKRSEVAGKRVCKKGRIKDKNSVLVKVAYEGTKRSFEMPRTSKLGQLHSLVETSLKLKGGTYDTQYFDGAEYVSMTCDANLHCCFAYAPRSPRSNSILLNLKSLG